MRGLLRAIGTPFRVIPWPLWLLILGAAAWFGRKWLLIAATILAFHPIPIPPLFQGAPRSAQEAQLQDLDHFGYVRRFERSMRAQTLARFDAQVAALKRRAGTMSEAEFMLGLARAQAVIDNAHSNTSPSAMVRRFPHLPIRTAYFGDELRVLRATARHKDLLGLQATHINGVAVEDVIKRFRNAFGGNDANFRVMVPLLLETPEYLAVVGLPKDDVSVRFAARNAAPFERKLSPGDMIRMETWTIAGDLPLFWRDSETLQAVQPAASPLFLCEPARGYWRTEIPELGAAYINLRTNLDDGSGSSLPQFVKETVAALRARAPRIAIVDLRFNHGGDYSLTHELMVALGGIVGPKGRIYFLTSGNTFSAAIVSIAFAKQAAPGRTVIVGDELGDRLQFWAEGWRYELPNTGFRARYSTAYYDLQHGCHGLFRCYWGAFHLFPVIVDDLDVDVRAPLTFEAYAAGRDPGLEAIEAAEAARKATQ